jgi:hypothetical protein
MSPSETDQVCHTAIALYANKAAWSFQGIGIAKLIFVEIGGDGVPPIIRTAVAMPIEEVFALAEAILSKREEWKAVVEGLHSATPLIRQ